MSHKNKVMSTSTDAQIEEQLKDSRKKKEILSALPHKMANLAKLPEGEEVEE